jgi:hypothetical protein
MQGPRLPVLLVAFAIAPAAGAASAAVLVVDPTWEGR